MHVGRLHGALVSVSQEIEKMDTPARLRQLSDHIKALMPSQPDPNGQSRGATGYKEYWKRLRDDLELCPSNLAGATQRTILRDIGAVKLTGTGLIETIEDIFQKSNVSPTDAVAALNRLSDEVEGFFARVGRLTDDLSGLGVEVDRREPGQCEIEIHIPIKDQSASLVELEKTIKQFDQYLRPLKRVAQENDSEGMMISALGSPGWQLTLNVDLMSAVVFSVIMREISHVRLRLEQRRELRESTMALYPPYVLEEMDRADAELFAAEYRRIAEQVVEDYGPKTESVEELKVLMTASVKFLAEKIEENVVFDFWAEPEKEMSTEEAQIRPEDAEKTRERIVAARKVNLLSGALLAAREGRQIPPAVSEVFREDEEERAIAASGV